MKIGLIRHYPVRHPFLRGWVAQSEVMEWFDIYHKASVEPLAVEVGKDWDVCYASGLQRARDTAKALFEGNIICSELLNEPVPSPLFKRNIRLPFLLWGLLLRIAILSDHTSQLQGRLILKRRLQELLPQLLSHQGNVLIVSHAFTMEVLGAMLLEAGFSGKKPRNPKHGVLYVFENV